MNRRICILGLLLLLLSVVLISCIHQETGTGGTGTDSTAGTTLPPDGTTTPGEEGTTPPVSGTDEGDDTTASPKPNIPLPETNPSEFPNPPDPDGTKRY